MPIFRELDERPARLKALAGQHPDANHAELGRLYEARFGMRLAGNTVTEALRRAGVLTRESKQQEVSARPHRIARLFGNMQSPTRDKLAQAYLRHYGCLLTRAWISKALRDAGINLREPLRKADRDECALRGERLKTLAQQNSNLTYDELGDKYEAMYGLRLNRTSIATALNRQGIFRVRLSDVEELALRPQRILSLLLDDPKQTSGMLAKEYKRRYGISLQVTVVANILREQGVSSKRPDDPEERAERPARLLALTRRHPDMKYAEVAEKYRRLYGKPLHVGSVESALRSLGIYRVTRVDPEEVRQRGPRVLELHSQFPSLTNIELSQRYTERYGVRLTPLQVTVVLHKAGIFRQTRNATPAEREKRKARLEKLWRKHPEKTYLWLAQEYEREYGIRIHRLTVRNTLRDMGLLHLRPHNRRMAKEHPQLLPALSRRQTLEERGLRDAHRVSEGDSALAIVKLSELLSRDRARMAAIGKLGGRNRRGREAVARKRAATKRRG